MFNFFLIEQRQETGLTPRELTYELFVYNHKRSDGTWISERDRLLDVSVK
jgi:hypothetical protein